MCDPKPISNIIKMRKKWMRIGLLVQFNIPKLMPHAKAKRIGVQKATTWQIMKLCKHT